eukprot:2302352-Rhodomonas_salina.2
MEAASPWWYPSSSCSSGALVFRASAAASAPASAAPVTSPSVFATRAAGNASMHAHKHISHTFFIGPTFAMTRP